MHKIIAALNLFKTNPNLLFAKIKIEFLAPTIWGIKKLRSLYSLILNNKARVDRANNDRLLFVYDSLVNPITFDFLHYLYCVNWMRKSRGLLYLDILIVNRPESSSNREVSYISAIGADNIFWRLTNLIVPLTRLFASVGRVFIVDASEAFRLAGRYDHMYPEGYSYANPKNAVCRLDQPGLIYQSDLTFSKTAMEIIGSYFNSSDARKIVTITLRSYDYISCRNSDIPSWIEFAKELDPLKFRVVFIPDASSNGILKIQQLESFEVFDSACWNIELRAALYHRAWMNMGVASGPLAISGLLNNVWTVMIDRSLDYPEDFYKTCYSTGVLPGKVPNFYSNTCQFYLGRDDASTLLKIFNEYVDKKI